MTRIFFFAAFLWYFFSVQLPRWMKWIYIPFSLKQQKIKIKSPPTAGWCYFFVKVLLHVYWINFYFVLDSTRSPCSSHFADFYLKCFWRLFNFYSNNQFNSANCSAMLLSTDLNVIFTILLWMCLAGRHSEWLSSKSSWVNDEQKKIFYFPWLLSVLTCSNKIFLFAKRFHSFASWVSSGKCPCPTWSSVDLLYLF